MLTWLLYLIGQAVHVLAQVESIVRAKNTTATSRQKVLIDRWPAFTIRFFVCTMVYGIFLSGELPNILLAMNIEPPDWIAALAAVMNSAAAPFIAGIIGYAIDSGLAFIPGLKSYIPELQTESVQSVEVRPVPGGIQTTTETKEVIVAPIAPKAGE